MRVLLVDDEVILGEVMGEVIIAMGHDVLVAHDGIEALAIILDQPLDLVITDVRMPRMNGAELVAAIGVLRPRLPVLVVTGHAPQWKHIMIKTSTAMVLDVLMKPFAIDELVRAMALVPGPSG